mmetsp:Transcript_72883/g.213796  ORF Transcript_72883/g.213796 Transcript_72883/m.213796 type:complete len:204 (+) Transcript_72883:340-951(+)
MHSCAAGRPFGPSMKRPIRFPWFSWTSLGNNLKLSPIRALTFGKAFMRSCVSCTPAAQAPPNVCEPKSTVVICTWVPSKKRAMSSVLRPPAVPDSRITSTCIRSATVKSATASLGGMSQSGEPLRIACCAALMRFPRSWEWASRLSKLRPTSGPLPDWVAPIFAPTDTPEAPTSGPPELAAGMYVSTDVATSIEAGEWQWHWQ